LKKSDFNNFLSGLKNMLPSMEENWKIIVLCFLGATIFWFFNALNKEYSARIKYPVEFVYDTNETVVVDPLPQDVRLEVRGGGWNLLRKTFWFNVDPVYINLSEPTEIKFLTSGNLKPVFIDQIPEIRIDEVLVDTLHLNIERKIKRALPIVVDSAGIRLAPDHKIVSPIRMSSDSIYVTGPSSQVNSLGSSIMLSLHNDVVNNDYTENINMSAYLPSKVSTEPSVVTISFDVQQFFIVSKEIVVQPINFPNDVTLMDSVITASVYVARNDLEKLNAGNINVVADYRRLNRRDSTISLRLMDYPEFISDIALDSETVKVSYDE
jgi:YbbR domain-containing protein